MPVFNNALAGAAGAGAAAGYQIKRSIRFNANDSSNLSNNFSGMSAGNRSKITFSFWAKFTGIDYAILGCGTSSTYFFEIKYNSDGNIEVFGHNMTATETVGQFRDPSAWYHICVAIDKGHSQASEKLIIYVNGIRQALTANQASSDVFYWNEANQLHKIGGRSYASSDQGNFLLAEMHVVENFVPSYLTDDSSGTVTGIPDAKYLTDFIEIDDNKICQPIAFTGNYGSRGFYLKFEDNSSNAALGTDSSGNSNTWTVNNISAQASTHAIAGTHQGKDGISFNGTNAEINLSSDSDLNPGSGEFTLECYAYNNNNSSEFCIIDGSPGGAGSLVIRRVGSGTLMVERHNAAFDITGAQFSQNTWHHVAVTRDSSNNVRLFVDGNQSGSTSTNNTHNYQGLFRLGRTGNGFTQGYISNFRLIKGTCLYTSNFTPPSGTLGNVTNTKLLMAQSTTSATAATVKPSGVTITGSGDSSVIDSLLDSPTNYEADSTNNGGNYATLNPLQTGSGLTLSNGSLDLDGTSSWKSSYSTIFLPTGKWYSEYTIRSITSHSYGILVGLAGLGTNRIESEISGGDEYAIQNGPGDMKISRNAGSTGLGSQSAYAVGDVLQLAYDADNGKLWFGKNGTYINSGNPSAGSTPVQSGISGTYCFAVALLTASDKISANFGQRPFAHTPPTGFKSVCTQNLDDPLIADGSAHFDTAIWSGDNTDNRTLSIGHTPDWIWIKQRNATRQHLRQDSVRGFTKVLFNGSEAEATYSPEYGKAATNGIVVNSSGGSNISGRTYVGWAWNAGDLVQSSNNLQTETWSAATGALAAECFDGNTSTQGAMVNEQWYKIAGSLTVSSSMRIYLRKDEQYKMRINGGTQFNANTRDTSISNNYDWAAISIPTGTHTNVEIRITGGGGYINAIEVDGKIMCDPGAIPTGSLNSSVYDQSQDWSNTSNLSGSYRSASDQYGPPKMFNGIIANESTAGGVCFSGFSSNSSMTWTSPVTFSNLTSLRLWLDKSGTGTGFLRVNGNNYDSSVTDGWVTIPETSLSTIQFGYTGGTGTATGVGGVEVNGKILLNTNATPGTNYPSIASTVRANPTAGFSIVSYTGTATAGTIGHGLNAKPSITLIKSRDSVESWYFYTDAIDGSMDYNQLEGNGSFGNSGLSLPTSNNFYVGSSAGTNKANDKFIAYCFAPVEGYSAFGSYAGNSSDDGPFVPTNFRPAWVMVKAHNAVRDWMIFDSVRGSYNVNDMTLSANSTSAEQSPGYKMDFLSNGFKLRASTMETNNSSYAYLYIAFAENPFANSRAR